MNDSDMMPNTEMQLELLLRELLDEQPGGSGESPAVRDLSPELIALRDLASRLREAGRQVPPSAASFGAQGFGHTGRAGLAVGRASTNTGRRYGAWVGIAAAMLLGVFGAALGAGSASASPASPWYSVRIALENLQVAITPDVRARAELLVQHAHARIAEIRVMAATGDEGGLRRAADALDADAEWLHAILRTLPPREQRQWVRVLGRV